MSGRSKEVTAGVPEDDGNYTQFDVTINTVNVTLSFSKWFNGKGLLHDVEIVGVRGVIDRTSVQKTDHYIDPKSYRHEHDTGDFEIDVFKMSDVLLSVYQPDNFRPFTVSVFNCELPRLRKQWLFYDFMSANNMSGSFDDSLFTVHPRQVHGHTGAPLTADGVGEDAHWKKHSRLRIDGLNIDHLNRGVEGPFGWIHEGNVDIVADVMIPSDEDSIWRQSFKRSAEAMSEFYDRIEHSVTQQTHAYGKPPHPSDAIPNAPENLSNANTTVAEPDPSTSSKFVLLDIRVHLNDVRASIPLVTRDLSYINNALVRPIVAYINSRRAFIPVTCRVVKRQSEFDGSWTIFDSGLMDDLSREVYDAFARDVSDDERRGKRMRKVGRWVVELVVEALFLGLAGQLA
jgi:distribution and morphology protein 31